LRYKWISKVFAIVQWWSGNCSVAMRFWTLSFWS